MGGLWASAVTLAENLSPADWDRPVQWCPDWNVADLVSHMAGLQAHFNAGAPPTAPPPRAAGGSPFDHTVTGLVEERRGWDPARRLEELRAAGQEHVRQLEGTTDWLEVTQGPVGPTTRDGLFHTRCFDLWVHLQDLREAVGLPVDTQDTSPGAETAHTFVLGLVPWMFVKRAGAADGATMRVTLGKPLQHDSALRVVERRATWDPTADPGDCLVTGAPAAMTLLTSGRGTPQRWRDDGVLDWRGPRGQEFVDRARLF